MFGRGVERSSIELAKRTSRRSFLGTIGRGFVALTGGQFVAAALGADQAQAYHLCGHIYTTGSCPHPFAPESRISREGWALHPHYGYPVDDEGRIYTSRKQKRRKICAGWVRDRYSYARDAVLQGTWSRCCSGRVRRLVDCCSVSRTRINGDASLQGYCYGNKRVFCVTYFDTNIKC